MATGTHVELAGPQSQVTTKDAIQRAISKASFAVIAHVTPSGEPRCSGVCYRAKRGRLYAAVAADSWKARHIAADGDVAVTVTVPRGGLLSLLFPIPPATISFPGRAIVHPQDSPEIAPVVEALGALLPDERRDEVAVIEIEPRGTFLTYGIGVPLRKLRKPELSQARVRV
jgi:hypothetical protein